MHVPSIDVLCSEMSCVREISAAKRQLKDIK